jgi:sugar/nucleoside kinase (ribokinase family)
VRLGPRDIDKGLITRGKILYLEGYLFDPPEAQEAFRAAAAMAHGAGRKVSLTLSDPFCVGRHRKAFLDLVEHHVDILFANEAEVCALYEVGEFDAALARVRGHCEIAALTRSARGSVIVGGGQVHAVAAHRVDAVVDTTGAGDLYAAGVLYGVSQGLDLPTCGRLGSLAAAEVIAHVGARPMVPLAQLAGPILG